MGLPKDSPFYPISADRVILETANTIAFYDGYPLGRDRLVSLCHEEDGM